VIEREKERSASSELQERERKGGEVQFRTNNE